MGNPNVKPSARLSLLGVIDPDAYNAAAYSTGWIDAGLYEGLLAMVAVGDMQANSTVDAKLEQATSAAGAGAKDVSGKAITQLTQAGTDDNKQALINMKSEDLDTNNGFHFVRLTVTVAVAASDMGAVLFGSDARYTPTHAATVDEVVG